MLVVITACGRHLEVPCALNAAREVCGMGRVQNEPVQLGDILTACTDCPFADKPVQFAEGDEAEMLAAKAARKPPAEPLPSPLPPGLQLDTSAQGIMPVPSTLQLEPLTTPDEAARQDTPPQIDVRPKRSEDEIIKALEEEGANEAPIVEPPPFERLLAERCKWWGAGGSLMGWSKLKIAKHCLRMFFYAVVLGIKRKTNDKLFLEERDPEKISPLELGSLVHAALERFYSTGRIEGAFEPIEAVKGAYPQLALEARRLVNFYLDRFNAEEVDTWDLRAVERESRYYFPARKLRGKRRSCCITARLDGCFRCKRPHEPRLQAGERAETGLHIHEIKTARSIGGSRLRGFYQKSQLLQNILTFNYGHAVTKSGDVMLLSLADLLGPCWTVTVSHIGKSKRQDPNRDIERTTFDIPPARVEAYASDIEDWYYNDVLDRLFSPDVDKALTWRRDWLCEDQLWPGWTCPFIPLCESDRADVDVMYEAGSPLDVEKLERPKKLEKLLAAKKEAIAKAEGK